MANRLTGANESEVMGGTETCRAMPQELARPSEAGVDLEAALSRLKSEGFLRDAVEFEKAHVFPVAVPMVPGTVPSAEQVAARADGDTMSLYVHIPFCRGTCSFCFYSRRAETSDDRMDRYVDALEREAQTVMPLLPNRPCTMVYFGGGTPTQLPLRSLPRLFELVGRYISPSPNMVFCTEASPETLDHDRVRILRSSGVNRISIGVQSLEDSELASVPRMHTALDAKRAVRRALAAGFPTVNIDLIYGLPHQTLSTWERTIRQAAELRPHSIFLYHLRVNPDMALWHQGFRPNRLEMARRYLLGADILQTFGYVASRPHAFTLPTEAANRYRCAPCTAYEGHGFQVGLGASAYSQVGPWILQNRRSIDEYESVASSGGVTWESSYSMGMDDTKRMFVIRNFVDAMSMPHGSYEGTFRSRFENDFPTESTRLLRAGLIASDAQGWHLCGDVARSVAEELCYEFYPPRLLDVLRRIREKQGWKLS